MSEAIICGRSSQLALPLEMRCPPLSFYDARTENISRRRESENPFSFQVFQRRRALAATIRRCVSWRWKLLFRERPEPSRITSGRLPYSSLDVWLMKVWTQSPHIL